MKNKFKYNRSEREKIKKELRVKEETLKELIENLSQSVFEKEKKEIKQIENKIKKEILKMKNIRGNY